MFIADSRSYLDANQMKLLFFSLILLGSPALFSGCRNGNVEAGGPKSGASGAAALPARTVKMAVSEQRELRHTVMASGTLAADEQATLSFKVPGRLAKLSIDLGSVVRKRQPIAQLETQLKS